MGERRTGDSPRKIRAQRKNHPSVTCVVRGTGVQETGEPTRNEFCSDLFDIDKIGVQKTNHEEQELQAGTYSRLHHHRLCQSTGLMG